MAVECGQTGIWEQRSGHNCPRGWSGASTAAAASGSTAAVGRQHQVHPDERPLTILIFACQVGRSTSSQPGELSVHPVITIPITTCELGGVPALLLPKPFVPMGLGANLASPPKWARAASLSPQRTRGTFGRERGQCQQVELREEGGAAGYLGGGAPI